ncbi:Uncharacterised protein [Vibrio cholerae]|nr:Uncharacterised protein [Vibrio cholerae]
MFSPERFLISKTMAGLPSKRAKLSGSRKDLRTVATSPNVITCLPSTLIGSSSTSFSDSNTEGTLTEKRP